MEELIEQIHSEFYTAQDNIMDCMYEELDKYPKEFVDKVINLNDIGFKNANEVREVKNKVTYFSGLNAFIRTISGVFYGTKIITQKQVDRICNTYGLKTSGVKNFIGFVPNLNLNEIDNFIKMLKKRIIMSNGIARLNESRMCYAFINEELNVFNPMSIMVSDNPPSSTVRFNQKLLSNENLDFNQCMSLMICAPGHDMIDKLKEDPYIWNTLFNRRLGLFSIKDNIKQEMLEAEIERFKDPIVLSPFKHKEYGQLFFVVTAWGDEASDPDIINPTKN